MFSPASESCSRKKVTFTFLDLADIVLHVLTEEIIPLHVVIAIEHPTFLIPIVVVGLSTRPLLKVHLQWERSLVTPSGEAVVFYHPSKEEGAPLGFLGPVLCKDPWLPE